MTDDPMPATLPHHSSPTGVVELGAAATAVAAAAPLQFYDPARELCPACDAAQFAFGTAKTYCQSPACMAETNEEGKEGKGRKVYVWTAAGGAAARKAKKEQLRAHEVGWEKKEQPRGEVGWGDVLRFFDVSPARLPLRNPLPMRMTAPESGQPIPFSYVADTAEPSPGVAGGDVAADPFIGHTVLKTFPGYGKEPWEGRVEKAVAPGKYLVFFERDSSELTMTSKALVALGLGLPAPPVPGRSTAPPVDATMEQVYAQVLGRTPDEINQLPAVIADSQGTKRSMRESEESPSKKTRGGDTYVEKECTHCCNVCPSFVRGV